MSGRGLAVRCPAKVNLLLRVLGRRPDGYHEIETVFQAIDLWDEIEASPAGHLTLVCESPTVPVDETNLVLRAATALRDRFGGEPAGASLRLHKRIPVGGGLGGGSSDAAGALLLLARLWGLPAGRGDLAQVAADLGSDAPFFLVGGTAIGRGRGERIEPQPFLGEALLLLGLPPFGIPTAEVYRSAGFRLTPSEGNVTVSGLSTGLQGGDFGFAANDLEALVFRRWPELQEFRDALLGAGALLALLSGSGSTVFGIFETEDKLQGALGVLEKRYPAWTLVRSRTIESGVRWMAAEPGGARGWKSRKSGSSPSKRTSSRRSPR